MIREQLRDVLFGKAEGAASGKQAELLPCGGQLADAFSVL